MTSLMGFEEVQAHCVSAHHCVWPGTKTFKGYAMVFLQFLVYYVLKSWKRAIRHYEVLRAVVIVQRFDL